MSFSTPEPVASAVPYPVTEIAGRTPTSLADFAGETSFTIEMGDRPYQVNGVGSERGDGVRFHEKDVAQDGKDIRVWTVSRGEGDRFVAQEESPF